MPSVVYDVVTSPTPVVIGAGQDGSEEECGFVQGAVVADVGRHSSSASTLFSRYVIIFFIIAVSFSGLALRSSNMLNFVPAQPIPSLAGFPDPPLMPEVLAAVIDNRAELFTAAARTKLINAFPSSSDCMFGGPSEIYRTVQLHINLSVKESFGFYDEADERWLRRKQRHLNEMCQQGTIMKTCPEGFHVTQRQCAPGCSKFPALCESNIFWQVHYEPTFSCEFARRIGNKGDGGKWICDPHRIQMKINVGKPCLVYSIGSHGQYGFEAAVHEQLSPHCEIHTVDRRHWSAYTSQPPPSYVHYHVYRIGLPPHGTDIATLVEKLGHTNQTIDIFKIDCEGCEWNTFPSWFGHGVRIRQIQVELHDAKWQTHLFFMVLFDLGYVVFYKEPNTMGCGGACVEYAFLKLAPTFSRAHSLLG